jgi:small subunit ribosomal protein S11
MTNKILPKKRKAMRSVAVGVAHIKATFNNTIVSITDMAGNVVAWSSAGRAGFSGSKKSSAFAATVAAQAAGKDAVAMGMKECEVSLTGPGAGRETAVRGIQSAGLMVTIIRDETPVPHNGCRARKRRRC